MDYCNFKAKHPFLKVKIFFKTFKIKQNPWKVTILLGRHPVYVDFEFLEVVRRK